MVTQECRNSMLRGCDARDLEPIMTQERKLEKEHEENRKKALIERGSQEVQFWCSCELCTNSGYPLENVCCMDMDDGYGSWKPSIRTRCITKSKGFKCTVLNMHVLRMMRHNLLMYTKDKGQRERLKSNSNSCNRFIAYKNFVSWISSGKKLGRSNRIIIPACVVNKIREKWPENSGIYTGFRPSVDIQD